MDAGDGDCPTSATLLQTAPATGKITGRKARLDPIYPEGTKGAGPLRAGPQHSVLLLLPDILQPGRVFRVAPMMDVNDVAVGVAQRATSARHASRIGDRRPRAAVRQQVLAERRQVQGIHGREQSMLGGIED